MLSLSLLSVCLATSFFAPLTLSSATVEGPDEAFTSDANASKKLPDIGYEVGTKYGVSPIAAAKQFDGLPSMKVLRKCLKHTSVSSPRSEIEAICKGELAAFALEFTQKMKEIKSVAGRTGQPIESQPRSETPQDLPLPKKTSSEPLGYIAELKKKFNNLTGGERSKTEAPPPRPTTPTPLGGPAQEPPAKKDAAKPAGKGDTAKAAEKGGSDKAAKEDESMINARLGELAKYFGRFYYGVLFLIVVVAGLVLSGCCCCCFLPCRRRSQAATTA